LLVDTIKKEKVSMFEIQPIAFVANERKDPKDDYWGNVISCITMTDKFNKESLNEIQQFSHLEIIFYFHLLEDNKIQYGSRHPRDNEQYPKVGIFSQRGKFRPNKLGLSTVKLLKVEGKSLYVTGLDIMYPKGWTQDLKNKIINL
jgi:tRNA (Thr-GGU) A37 N-methylase